MINVYAGSAAGDLQRQRQHFAVANLRIDGPQ
jgi:hypothetical protein